MPNTLRGFRANDLDALCEICLKTGDAGQDATTLYRDSKLLGQVYAAPYGVLQPESCFVLEDDAGVGGYIIGTCDTYAFEKRLEREWLPDLRAQYPDLPDETMPDRHIAHLIHHPNRTPHHQRALSGASAHRSSAALSGQRLGQAHDRSLARRDACA